MSKLHCGQFQNRIFKEFSSKLLQYCSRTSCLFVLKIFFFEPNSFPGKTGPKIILFPDCSLFSATRWTSRFQSPAKRRLWKDSEKFSERNSKTFSSRIVSVRPFRAPKRVSRIIITSSRQQFLNILNLFSNYLSLVFIVIFYWVYM